MTQIDNNEALAREVDEELAKERLAELGRRYGPTVIGVVSAALIAVSGYVWWQNNEQSRRIGETAQLLNLSASVDRNADADTANALAAFEQEASPGLATLAQFEEARARLQLGQAEEAAELLDYVATRAETPSPFDDIALLVLAQRQLDSGDPQALADRLQRLDSPNSPWRLAAAELRAQLLFRAGDAEAAIARLEAALADPEIEASQSERLGYLRDRYRAEANDISNE